MSMLDLLAAPLVATLLAAVPTPQAAQPRPAVGVPTVAEDPLLTALVAEALERNPELRAAQDALIAARDRPVQARALPDPSLGVLFTNEGWSPNLGAMPDSSLGVMGSQDLPYPGKRRLRGRLAELEAVEVEQRLVRAQLSIAASVRRAYYDLLAARALRTITSEQAGLWEQTEGVARARYGVGQGTQQDVLRTQVEITRVQQLLAQQDADEAISLGELNGLLARPATTPLETASSALRPAVAGEPLEAALSRLRERSPELRAARNAAERAKVAVELARLEYKPDLTVQAAYMNRGGLDPMWQAGVTVTLPLARGRRRAAVAEAEAGARSAAARLESVELRLRFRTQERLTQIAAARGVATLYDEGVIPQGRMSVEGAIANYQTGRVPFVTVLEAAATLYNDRATHVRVLAASQATLAALEEASLDPTPNLPAIGAAGAGASVSGGAAQPAAMSGMSR